MLGLRGRGMIPDENWRPIPSFLLTDSYKLTHPVMQPPASRRIAYAEFRKSYEGDEEDHRIVFFGLRFYLEKFLNRPWTMAEFEATSAFLKTHLAGHQPFPWTPELFREIIEERDGWFPVLIRAMREGSVIYPHVPVYTIEAEGEKWSGLVTFLETLLTISVWYPSTVATLSRRCRDLIQSAFDRSVDGQGQALLESRLHDFGFRACASLEQAIHGGTAHLLNFRGTDTLPAAYFSQYCLNGGRPVAESIPASEHSVMMGYSCDAEAMRVIIEEFGDGPAYSIVMDTFDYERALKVDLPVVAARAKEKGGFLVIRPDSGDPLQMILEGLEAASASFGQTLNTKGYKVINGAGIIFGDSITYEKLKMILPVLMDAGWSAQNVAFGMGSHLLHRVHRDTMSFATKVSYMENSSLQSRDLAKQPKTDASKFSLPGRLAVTFDAVLGHPVVHPGPLPDHLQDLLQIVYDHGPVKVDHQASFDEMRARLVSEWEAAPKKPSKVISPELQQKIDNFKQH